MKKHILLSMAGAAVMALGFTSCSSDDTDGPDNPQVVPPSSANVFTKGLPQSVGGARFTSAANGQVTEITKNGKTWKFSYGQFTYGQASYSVMMTVQQTGDPDVETYYFQTNDYGFATNAIEVENGGSPDTYAFTYNTDNQLTAVQGSDSDDSYTISYSGGNISQVKNVDGNETTTFTFSYTNEANPQPVANLANVMLYDTFYMVDLGDLDMAYYAGLLGKSTADLPMGYEETSTNGKSDFNYSLTYNWEFNVEGYPTKYWQGQNQWYVIDFVW